MLQEKDLLLIEDYLDGELKGEALQAFEQRLKAEPELAETTQLHREVNENLLRVHKTDKMKEWKAIINASPANAQPAQTTVTTPDARPSRRRWLYYVSSAAAVALLFWGIFTLFPQSNSSNELAQQYWEDSSSFLATSIERGNTNTDSQLMVAALLQYKKQDFQAALQTLNTLNAPNNESALLVAACHFQLDHATQAINSLRPLVDNPQSLIKDEAQWYLALAYLKDGQTKATREQLNDIINRKSWNWKKAQDLLNQL